MFSNDFVVSILKDGTIIQDNKAGIVTLPFGSEYSIRLRNKNSRRALARVYIDEENVTENGIILPANSYVDLERPTNNPNCFKFVSIKSDDAANAGKRSQTDGRNGVVRVEWQLEKEIKWVYPSNPWPIYTENPWKKYHTEPTWTCTQYGPAQSGAPSSFMMGFNSCEREEKTSRGIHSAEKSARKKLSEGCTVEGSASDQTFTYGNIQVEGPITTIRLILQGYICKEGTQKGLYCESCGAKAKSKSAKFCYVCGKRIN